ncbi:MAG: DUF3604 domain-containing protein [Candidatus Binatia bacterium]|nr:DUF3604 domain-containing protein [Candidatus Binatia bacterium]
MKIRVIMPILAALLIVASGCSDRDADTDALTVDPMTTEEPSDQGRFPRQQFPISDEIVEVPTGPNRDREAFFGDLHVHTAYSFDAYAFGTTAMPSDAYRYAKGEGLLHPGGFNVKLREPLDFYAVTDHAMFLGLVRAAADTSTEFSKLPLSEPLHDLNAPDNMSLLSVPQRIKTFGTFIPNVLTGLADGSVDKEIAARVTKSAWQDTIDAAEHFNEPGEFTTFVAYEYTSSSDDRGNLHRNVIFKDSDHLPAVPFSRFHSQNPEGLWDWMDGLREQGIESLAIPHNSNGSNGQMFKLVDWAGDPLDDTYAEQRARNEPLVEITQVKGTSDTHPALSDSDEWADFEIMPYRVATMLPSAPPGSYVRDALRRGLFLEERGVENPYKFGFIGSSDTHTGAISDDESNFFSKVGILDSTPQLRGSVPLGFFESMAAKWAQPNLVKELDGREYGWSATATYGASGLAAVWAEENTRAAIYDAFRRKETFATSGPRMRVRFFAGFDLDEDLLNAHDVVSQAYARGVTMGADLPAKGIDRPSFLAWATRDPKGTPLQRLQIIKGWSDADGTYERVYDIACSEGAKPDPKTHRCPDNGAKVNISTCEISTDTGSDELSAVWSDPDFDPAQRAFYYVRALENPTCRWSTWDAVRAGVEPRPDLPQTLQERAWSSPIWYLPTGETAPAAGAL